MTDREDSTVKISTNAMQSVIAELPERYEVESVVGQGGMGMVFKALDKSLSRTVAIKILLTANTDQESQERFEREARALSSLDHPNIVKILSWGVNSHGNPFHVLEFLDGQPLSSRLGGGKRLSPEQFHEIFGQILSALSYAHEKGIVHRDLKPNNILLTEAEGQVTAKVIDFGIARVLRSEGEKTLTATNHLIGSPNYMSPEQCRGAKVDHLSDIYSLACVMYEALTGAPPHQAETPMETMYLHMSKDAAKLEALGKDETSKQLGRIVDRCLSREAAARPQSAQQLLAQLEDAFRTRPEAIDFAGESRPKTQPRLLAIVGAILITSLSVAGFVYLKQYVSGTRGQEVINKERETKIARLAAEAEQLEQTLKDESELRRASTGNRLMNKLLELAQAKIDLQSDYRGAIQVTNKIIQLSGLLEPIDKKDNQASALLMRAKCYMSLHNTEQAEKALSDGLQCKICNAHVYYKIRPELALEMAKMKIVQRKFDDALTNINIIFKASFTHDAWTSKGAAVANLPPVDDRPRRVRVTSEYLTDYLKSHPTQNDAEKIAVLKIYNRLANLYIEDSFYKHPPTFDGLKSYTESVSDRSPETKKLLSNSYLLLSKQAAATSSEQDTAEKYKQLSESIAR